MYPLTRREIAAERAESQAEDARERLANIRDARTEALDRIRAAIAAFADEVDAQGLRRSFDRAEIKPALEAIGELLDEAAFRVVHDLQDAELGEGDYDLAAAADDAAERRWDARREEGR